MGAQMREDMAEPFWKNFREDLQRHFIYHPDASVLRKLRIALEVDGIWAMATYRWARALRGGARKSLLGKVASAACGVATVGVRWVTGISLDPAARIGPG